MVDISSNLASELISLGSQEESGKFASVARTKYEKRPKTNEHVMIYDEREPEKRETKWLLAIWHDMGMMVHYMHLSEH